MRKPLLFVVLVTLGYVGLTQFRPLPPGGSKSQEIGLPAPDALAQALENRASGVQVEGRGNVIKILPDDNMGSRHQRFILKLQSGQTVMVAHNIDIAPRIASLKKGNTVAFYGEYEWNPQGGIIHWTHHDPGGRHVAGWLMHDGRTYR